MKRYTVRLAAEELGISESLMYALLERRLVRHERHGLGRGRYVIPEDALEEYRRSRVVGVCEFTTPIVEPQITPKPKLILTHLNLS